MAKRHYTAAPGDTLRLRAKFYLSGVLTDPVSFPADVALYTVPTGGTPIATATPVKDSDGIFYIDYVLPSGWASTALYDEWTWIGTAGAPTAVQRYESELELTVTPSPPEAPPVEAPFVPVGHIFEAVAKTQPDDPPSSGFVAKAVPRSVREAISKQSHDRLKTIAKSALENYIRSFLDTDGQHREVIKAIAKGTLQYITDKSLDKTDDVTVRATQLARLFNDIKQKTPSILIIDSGMDPVPTGLMSGLTHATLFKGNWQGWFLKKFRIPITLGVLTNDQDSTDQLIELVQLTIDSLRQTAGGSLMCSPEPGHNWAVSLPLTQGISSTSGTNITEDNKDQLWFANIDLALDAEDTFAINLPFDGDYDGGIAKPQWGQTGGLILPPEIIAPDMMQVNQPAKVVFKKIRHTHKIVIDQPMIATIDVQNRVVTPRRIGTFTIQVLDLASRQNESGPRALAPKVAAQKSVTVTL